MRALLGMIHQTVLSAIRSRLFISELLAVLLIALAGPRLLESDGSLTGYITLTVRYSLAAIWFLLGLGILWAAGAEISADIASRRLLMVVSKPVGGIRLMLGRWLGLVGLHSILLLLGVAVTAIMIGYHSRTFTEHEADRTVRLAHSLTRPLPAVTAATIRERFEALQRNGQLAPAQTYQDVAPLIRSSLLAVQATVNPNETRSWQIAGSALRQALKHAQGNDAWLRFRFTSSAFDRIPITGVWTLHVPGVEPLRTAVSGIQDGEHVVALPVDQLQELASQCPEGMTLTLAFQNGAPDESCTIMFDTLDPLELLLPRSSLGLNMLRATFVMIASLGALAALGLLCGVLFSAPVAAVAGLGILAAIFLAVGTADTPWADTFDDSQPMLRKTAYLTDAAASGLRRLARPAIRHQTLTRLTAAEWLSATTLNRACMPLLGLYALPLILLAGTVLNRRQLGAT